MVATPITAEEYEEMQQIARATCTHPSISRAQVNAFVWVTSEHDGDFTHTIPMHHVECIACGAWLPLGPSNDEYETADDEITLGEMIADVHCRLQGSEADAFIDFHVECAVDFDAMLNMPAPEGATP